MRGRVAAVTVTPKEDRPMVRLDIPISVARECVAPLAAATVRVEAAMELARTDESFAKFERECVALDCLLHALRCAIRADEAECARKVAEAESRRRNSLGAATLRQALAKYPPASAEGGDK